MAQTERLCGPQTLAGLGYKLVSSKGTLLGVLTVPGRFAAELTATGRTYFVLTEPVSLSSYLDVQRAVIQNCKQVLIQMSYRWDYLDAVELHGATPEEIERYPGFAFAPSAAYMRSLLSEG